MTETNWHDAILDTLRRLVGAEQTANVLAAWHEHASRTRPEVTLLGPYSAGKSTLLRRLVVDAIEAFDRHGVHDGPVRSRLRAELIASTARMS